MTTPTHAEIDALVARLRAHLMIWKPKDDAADMLLALKYLAEDRAARNMIDPTTRLHNLCDHLAEQRAESPFTAEALDAQDEAYREQGKKLIAAEAELAALKAAQVPREPTDAMLNVSASWAKWVDVANVWRAMWDAAQQQGKPNPPTAWDLANPDKSGSGEQGSAQQQGEK